MRNKENLESKFVMGIVLNLLKISQCLKSMERFPSGVNILTYIQTYDVQKSKHVETP